MNIDIVNKEIANELSIKEKDAELINKFYWNKNKEHMDTYNVSPLNVEGLFVFHPDKWFVKKAIYRYIFILRNLYSSKKYNHNSKKYKAYAENYTLLLRKAWNVRKQLKYTN